MKKNLSPTLLALAVAQALSAPAFAQQNLPEVVITGSKAQSTDRASVGGFGETSVMLTPASVSVIGSEQLKDMGMRLTTEAMRLDPSVGDAYNAVGYAELFSIRGYNLDNATSYRKDGFAIPGDTQIPLENKERIEVLKGLAGLQAGIASPGGIINYVTKRPTAAALHSANVGLSERGTVYGAIDLGGRFDDARFGYRLNAADERIRSQIKGADGQRQFFSAAFDWRIAPGVTLNVDGDYQHKAQVSAPGYQLINNETLPQHVSASMLLNDQPWAKPVDTTSSNFGFSLDLQLDGGWKASVSGNRHEFKRDDFTAFPYGCDPAGLYPGFCANGDYSVWDYQSVGEKQTPWGLQLLVQGKAGIHSLSFGASTTRRKAYAGAYVYDLVGTSNIYHNVIVGHSNNVTGPVGLVRDEEDNAVFVQDTMALAQAWQLQAGLRYVQAKRKLVPTNDHFVLPSAALLYTPDANMTAYVSLAQGMEHGGIAPLGTTNYGQALSPSRSHQTEVGVKLNLNKQTQFTASVFDISKGLEFTSNDIYVRMGQDQHRGLELQIQTRFDGLELGAMATALNTRQKGTGQADLDGKRMTDVPSLRSALFADYAVPQVAGLKLNAMWQYSGKKAFDQANTVFVPDYSVLNVGASYATRVGQNVLTLRAFVDNATNKFYWRDVTPALGGYLIPGLPRVAKLSATLDF